MGDQDDARAVGAGELDDERADRLGAGVVEFAGRLVGEQQRRPVGQGRAQRRPLALAAGQFSREGVSPVGQPRRPEKFIDPTAALPPRPSPQRDRQPDRITYPKVRAQRRGRVLPEESHQLVSPPRPGACWHPADVAAQHADDPGRRLLDPRDHSQQRALPGAARAQHAQHLATGQFEVRPLQGRCVPLGRPVDAEHIT